MHRTVMVLVAALCATALSPLAAQQAAGPAPAAEVRTAPASSPNTAQPGPRIQPEYQRFEPSVTDSSASRSAALMSSGGSHTIVLSTLALILVVVIVVLLVVK
ncbi:MAG: hypothetical protein ACM368_07690 [Gemmatimonadota bacterium]